MTKENGDPLKKVSKNSAVGYNKHLYG